VVNAINYPATRDRTLDQFVQKGLQVCVERIWVNENGFHHRHHGTWGMMRSCTRSAVVLIAAKKCENLIELIPLDWEVCVRKVISLLEFWSTTCGDAGSRRDILEDGLEDALSSRA
jgi:hypothetical protein